MPRTLHPKHLHRLDIQGFDTVPEDHLAEVAPWPRMAFFLCACLAIIGTALASVPFLLALTVIAGLGALSPVHPFDLLYNHGIRRITGTRPLPRRGAPVRFACGLGAVWLVAVAWAFNAGMTGLGYGLGFAVSAVAMLVGTTDICIPSMIYRAIFGPPTVRIAGRVEAPERAGSPTR